MKNSIVDIDGKLSKGDLNKIKKLHELEKAMLESPEFNAKKNEELTQNCLDTGVWKRYVRHKEKLEKDTRNALAPLKKEAKENYINFIMILADYLVELTNEIDDEDKEIWTKFLIVKLLAED